MICLEPALAKTGPKSLEPGGSWSASQTLTVSKLWPMWGRILSGDVQFVDLPSDFEDDLAQEEEKHLSQQWRVQKTHNRA